MLEYSEKFEIANAFTKAAEGGLVDDKRDPGGITNHGISLRFLDKFANTKKGDDFLLSLGINNADRQTIIDLTQEQAKEIYYHEFWNTPRISDLPLCLAIATYDMAVNAGQRVAIKHLQRALGVDDDGYIGNLTLLAVSNCNKKSILKNILEQRQEFYKLLASNNPEQYKWALNGWLKRVKNLKTYLQQQGCL